MPEVGDRIRMHAIKVDQPPREGVVTSVSGALLHIRWSTGEETAIIPWTRLGDGHRQGQEGHGQEGHGSGEGRQEGHEVGQEEVTVTDKQSIEDVLAEDPGPLIDPADGPPHEGLIGIYDDPHDPVEVADDE
jgi:hypothetical protein